MPSARSRYRLSLGGEKFSFRDIIMKSVSKLTASVCDERRAPGSLRSKLEKRGRTSRTRLSPDGLWRNLTKSPVMGGTASRNALFFLRASISPSGCSLQTRW